MEDNESPETEPKLYTEDEVNARIKEAQLRQLRADEMRTYGNMFFAEAIDHISTLAKGDKVWGVVYQYGNLFRSQFEANTGQVQPEAPPPAKKQKETQSSEK